MIGNVVDAYPMDLFTAVRTRRSVSRLSGPAPDDAEMAELVQLAMNCAADHALLRPWRLNLVRGSARNALGEAMASASPGADPAKTRAKPLRAPLLVAIVLRPQPHPKVPEWEQLAATVGIVTVLSLLLHGRGWGAIWRSGPLVESAEVRRAAGVTDQERLLGWLYVGTPDQGAPRPARPAAVISDHLRSHAGIADIPMCTVVQ